MRTTLFLFCLVTAVLVSCGSHAVSPEANATQKFVQLLTSVAVNAKTPSVEDISWCLTDGKSSTTVNCKNNMVKLELEFLNSNTQLPGIPYSVSGSQIMVGMLKLKCKDNQCRGPLPSSWMSLSKLQELQFDGFQLSGTLPCDWTHMTSLTKLELENGATGGPLPELPISLRQLDLRKNSFCGTLPNSWASLPLKSFNLEVNDKGRLCGCTPSWTRRSKLRGKLKGIGFDKNTGCSIVKPTCDGSCLTCGSGGGSGSSIDDPTLRFLRLLGKAFRPLYTEWTGDDWAEWPGVVISSAVSISLRGAQLRGALPQLPSDLDGSQVKIASIDLSDSATVVGTLPASWGTLSQLKSLTLSDTLISGTLPAEWSGMQSLTTLNMRNTLLCGALPNWAMPSLKTVDLSSNKYLRGSLNPTWAAMPELKQVVLGANVFCGDVPPQWPPGLLISTKNGYANCSYELNKCSSRSVRLGMMTAVMAIMTVFVSMLW